MPSVQAFSDRAGSNKKEVGMEDVMLAIQAKAMTSFVTPPSQEVGLLLLAVHAALLMRTCLHQPTPPKPS